MGRLVHSGKFEYEIGQSAEEQEDCYNHPKLVLAACPEGGHEQNEDGDRDGGNRKTKLCVCQPSDNYQELHREAQEKEEIKFQQGDVDLRCSQRVKDLDVVFNLTWKVRKRRFIRRSALMCL